MKLTEKFYCLGHLMVIIPCAMIIGFILGKLTIFSSPSSEAAVDANIIVNRGFISGKFDSTRPTGRSYIFRLLGKYRVTAYCPCEICCGKWAELGVDSDGERVTPGNRKILPGDKFVAADPKILSRGDWVYVPGYGTVEVRDVGGSIKGKRLDVFFPTHQEALNWGIKHIEIKEIVR